MNHEESKLQQACVSWFRAQYPQYAMLLVHPINEGSGHASIDRRRQDIHKAEGAVAGVPDLILFMPTVNEYWLDGKAFVLPQNGAGFEFKTSKGSQSQAQKDYEKIFVSAGYFYKVIRCFEEFKKIVNEYISVVPTDYRQRIAATHVEIVQAAEQREKEKFYKIIGKK